MEGRHAVSMLWKQHQKEDNGNTEKIRRQGGERYGL